jgi:ABC-type uncharacterized transport system substrate-binding protein
MSTPRVLILNSYTLTGRRPEEQVRIRSFLEGLARGGYRAGENVEVEILDSNDLGELAELLRDALARPAGVIHAVGTPNAILAAGQAGGIPIVYYGAHPEGAGWESCSRSNLCGMSLALPFTAHYKSFRFLRKLVPEAERLWVPFFAGTLFCSAAMHDKHRSFRDGGGPRWVPMGSPHVGYRSLAGLAEIIGLDYRELVYRDAGDLAAGLAEMDREGAVLMSYNDGVYCAGAPALLAAFSRDTGVPLVWNNNPEATRIGALAAFAGCFREAGLATGEMAARLLAGATPAQLGHRGATRSFASLNLRRAGELGFAYPADVLARFDEVLN